MKTRPTVAGVAPAVVAGGLVLAVAVACGQDRNPFDGAVSFPEQDASDPKCLYQCSLDGRSRTLICDGNVTETVPCPPELACGGGVCQEPCAAAAADRSSNGCEFYFQAPRYSKMFRQSCYAAFVVNTSLQEANVSLEHEGKPLDISKSLFRTAPGSATLAPHSGPLPPGEGAILFVSDRNRENEAVVPSTPNNPDSPCPEGVVPASYADVIPNGTGVGSSFHLSANVPVSLASIYPFGGAPSKLPTATLHLPVSAWAKEHVLVNGWESGRLGKAGVAIVASEDDTEITLLPNVDLQNGANVIGVPAGTPWSFRLEKGQNLQLVQAKELTGSFITSNKPIGTFGGHACAFIPNDMGACDYLTQQIPALEQWGSEYVGVGYRPRLGNEHEPVIYRIVAARDGTKLEYDPPIPPAGAPVTMSAGEARTFSNGTGDGFVVRTQDADHPIHVAVYMSGGEEFGGPGDPEFVNVVPAGQYLSSYTFYADPTYRETSLVIVRAKSGGRFHDVWLECAGNLTEFRPIGTKGEFEYVRVDLSRSAGPGDTFDAGVCQVGMQRMRSDGPFTASVWGWSDFASYGYAGGMALRKLVPGDLSIPR